MSEGGIDEPKSVAGTDRSWLHEQGLQLMLLVGSAMTAVCYLVGRAGLLGWYEAAGVPQLKFSWSVQDVVVRGFADTDTWFLVGAVVVISALYFVLMDLASGRITKIAQSWERLRMRGEPFDRVRLRRRWASAARVARQKRLPSAERLTLDWRALQVRGQFRKHRAGLGRKKWRPSTTFFVGVISICILCGAFGFYVFTATVLLVQPFRVGAKNFHDEYIAATGKLPPGGQLARWRKQGDARDKEQLRADAAMVGRARLGGYRYIQLDAVAEAGTPHTATCGWLVQASEGDVLLLTSEGIMMKSFGDAPFSWKVVEAGKCDGLPDPKVTP